MADDSGERAKKRHKVSEIEISWLEEDIFKDWLAPSLLGNKAHCILCDVTITCCKLALINHSKTIRHIRHMTSLYNKCPCSDNNTSFVPPILSHKDKVKHAENRLTEFFAEHNIPADTINHLIPLIQDVCKDQKVVQDVTLARDKCAYIVKQVIAKREIEQLVEQLKICKFSILVDDTTDISDSKLMCFLVKFVSPINQKVTTQLLDIIPLKQADCSASGMFQAFKNSLDNKGVPIKNIVGMACNNAPVMIGPNDSFMTHLQTEVPHLITLKCLCQTSAIIASKACSKLPEECENLIRAVATYISSSSKKCKLLVEFQTLFEAEHLKILKSSNTRWLCLHKCVSRLVENWDELKSFFALAVDEDRLKSAEKISKYLNNASIKAYMYFLKYSLNFFNIFNALFQSREILIHKFFENSQQLIRQIGQNFIKPEALKDVVNLDLKDRNIMYDIKKVYVGPECKSILETLDLQSAQQIRSACLQFYITAVREMLARLSLQDTFFRSLIFLDPKVALYHEARLKIRDLTDIARRVNFENITQLAFEWRILPSNFDEERKKELAKLEIDDMWSAILKSKNFDGEEEFTNLRQLIQIVLSLPHSNSEAERIFSIVTDVKARKRNLSTDSVSSICVVRSSFESRNVNCVNFEVDARHLELHNAQNLYKKTINN